MGAIGGPAAVAAGGGSQRGRNSGWNFGAAVGMGVGAALEAVFLSRQHCG